MLKLLLDFGAEPNFKDGIEQSVLYYIVREGNIDNYRVLKEKGNKNVFY